MNMNIDLIRAWKDEEYRNSLNEAELANLPQNPAGMMDLTEEDLETVSGDGTTNTLVPQRTYEGTCGYACSNCIPTFQPFN